MAGELNLINSDTPNAIYVFGGAINKNITWPSTYNKKYVLLGSVTVAESKELRLEPGIEVQFRSYSYDLIVNGTLKAEGTVQDTIVFRGTDPTYRRNGGTINLTSSSQNSVLHYVKIDRLGDNFADPDVALQIASSSVEVRNSLIQRTDWVGIWVINEAQPLIQNVTLTQHNRAIEIGGISTQPNLVENNILNNSNYGIINLAADTIDARNQWWGDASGPYHPTLNPDGKGNRVSDKVDFDPWLKEPAYSEIVGDVSVLTILNEDVICGASELQTLQIRVVNFGEEAKGNFEVAYQINNGAIIRENIGDTLVASGEAFNYTFTQLLDLSTVGNYTIKAFTLLPNDESPNNDSASISIESLPVVGNFNGVFTPAINQTEIPVSRPKLSWPAVANATQYDIFFWKSDDEEPTDPAYRNIDGINFTLPLTLAYNTSYQWKVKARNACSESISELLSFSTIGVADLVVDTIFVPKGASTGQEIEVRWRIKNIGTASTGSQSWQDRLYFSDDQVLDNDYFIGIINNPVALAPGETYTGSTTYNIPNPNQGIRDGEYYIIVQTDYNNRLTESNNNNNLLVSEASIQISATPPPDLFVEQVVAPTQGFSGIKRRVSWTVKNERFDGNTGPTFVESWQDRVYLSADTIFNPKTDIRLGTFVYNDGVLEPGESYSKSEEVTLPNAIDGTYYFFVETDVFDQVFEYGIGGELNNTHVSEDSIEVVLTPPADLVVSQAKSPEFFTGGQKATLEWTVTNQGGSAPFESVWFDDIYLSPTSNFDPDQSHYIGRVRRQNTLEVDSSYTVIGDFQIPKIAPGNYYVCVITDALNQVFEFEDNEFNNATCTENTAELRTADLIITNISHPVIVDYGNKIEVTWEITNQGQGALQNINWEDEILISDLDTYNSQRVMRIGTKSSFASSLAPGESVEITASFMLPNQLNGDYYVYVLVDRNNTVFEFDQENNNLQRGTNVFRVDVPDLRVIQVTIPANAIAGETMQVQWQIQNAGPGNIAQASWSDRLILSNHPTPGQGQEQVLANRSFSGSLAKNDVLNRETTVSIPQGLKGNYYVYVLTDITNLVFEAESEGNNTGISALPVSIQEGKAADLQVTAIRPQASNITLGQRLRLEYIIQNLGEGKTSTDRWNDRIYISHLGEFNPNQAILLNTLSRVGVLEPNETYTRSTLVNIPANLAEGEYYFYVFTDATNAVFEDTNENNNVSQSDKVNLDGLEPVDLQVNTIMTPEEGNSGEDILVQWRVDNLGNTQTLRSSWLDGIFLSQDTIFEPTQDLLIKAINRNNPFNQDNFYVDSRQVKLPDGISGNYYLFVAVDYQNTNNDKDFSNNYDTDRTSDDLPEVLTINLSPTADLALTDLNTEDGVAGQAISVSWEVENQGSVATKRNSWSDKIFLSTNAQLDNQDVFLGSQLRNAQLEAGAKYEASLDVFIPVSIAPANYFLIVKTDANDAEYEHQAEGNNTLAQSINITQAPNSDLVISLSELPVSVEIGKNIELEWTTTNQGQNPAKGVIREVFYLSEDSQLDENDVLFATKSTMLNLNPGQQNTEKLDAKVKDVAQGQYFVLGRTDALNNIPEDIEDNNLSPSPNQVQVQINELVLETNQAATLIAQQELYYRIEIPENLAGESLMLSLTTEDEEANNEVYLRFEEVPNRSTYDFKQEDPFLANQEVIIPSLKAGRYYLMVYGNVNQSINLYADILEFGISKVESNQGGNTGLVTVKVSGAQFTENMQLSLVNTSQNVSIPAAKVYYVDPTAVFASFDLAGKALGLYDVVALNDESETATLTEGFEVVAGQGGSSGTNGSPGGLTCSIMPIASGDGLVVDTDAPDAVRNRRFFSVAIRFENQGNIDVPVQTRLLVSTTLAPVGFSVDELTENKKELILELKEKDGPPNVLRPGAKGEIRFYSQAIDRLLFRILE